MVASHSTPQAHHNLKAPYEIVDLEKRLFKCKTCNHEYKGKTTSNLISHLEDHKEEYHD